MFCVQFDATMAHNMLGFMFHPKYKGLKMRDKLNWEGQNLGCNEQIWHNKIDSTFGCGVQVP
jgi:hypothetical protein